MSAAAIVSCGVGGWYPRGIKRLEASLIHHGWAGATQLYRDEWPSGSPTHQDQPYGFKLGAIQHARATGHDRVLWLDSSAWAIKNPRPIFDRIQEEGHYFWTSGYNCARWCNDRCLEYFQVTREFAATIPMIYALVVGLDFRNERSRRFFDRWQQALNDGIFNGIWQDHRHDQSCASIIAFQEGMSIDNTHDLCHLYEPNMPETVCLTFQGL